MTRRPQTESGPTLQQLAEQLQHFTASVRDYAIFLLDPDGYVVSWNSGAEHIKGYKPEEIIGQHFSRFYLQEALDRGWPDYELQVARREGRFEDEGWRVRKDGSTFWANVVITALYDESGDLRGFSKITRDLTERRLAEERLSKANADLERRVAERTAELEEKNAALAMADRRKDEFLAILAHELRNPLAPIRTGLEVLKLAGDDRQIAEETREMMEQQLAQMVRLIDDLLEVSRVTRGKMRLRKERTELASTIKLALEATKRGIEESSHTLTVTLPEEPIYLDADPIRLTQIFSNLLSNAAKYTEPGGQIWLNAHQEGHRIVVSVKDTGIGIPATHLPKIFEMFSQVESALERSRGGLGIGLSLARGLVEMHGGTIEARSEGPGKGSEFIVRLPVVSTITQQQHDDEKKRQAAEQRVNCRVVVADDNFDAAKMLATMLKILGHDVHVAQNGIDAVRLLEAHRPRVALLDIGMPGMNGYEVARHIREQPWGADMVLVAVTGWSQAEDKRRAIEAGFRHHLTKPVEAAAVQKILAQVAACREN